MKQKQIQFYYPYGWWLWFHNWYYVSNKYWNNHNSMYNYIGKKRGGKFLNESKILSQTEYLEEDAKMVSEV